MPLLVLMSLFVPRFVFVFLYIFSDWFTGVSNAWYWSLLGFIFMPYSTLWYSVVYNWYGAEWTVWQTSVMIFTIIVDLTSGSRFRRGK